MAAATMKSLAQGTKAGPRRKSRANRRCPRVHHASRKGATPLRLSPADRSSPTEQRRAERVKPLRAWSDEEDDLFDNEVEGDLTPSLKDVRKDFSSFMQKKKEVKNKGSSISQEAADKLHEKLEEDFDENFDENSPSTSSSWSKRDKKEGLWTKGNRQYEAMKEKLDQWKKTKAGIRWLRYKDRLYPQDCIPPVGDATISYSRLLELLAQRRVKRLTIMNEGRDAIVEVPVPNCANDFSYQEAIEGVSEKEPEMIYCGEAPEWSMEKDRFYCPLPGDMWTDTHFLDLCKENLPKRGLDGKVAKENRLITDQCYLELVIHQPDYYWMCAGRVLGIAKPFATLLLVQFGLTVWYRNKKRKEEEMRKQKDYFRKSLAKAFNVKKAGSDEMKSTGVDFADVAGVDNIKSAISQVMEMLVSDVSFTKAGVKPPRGMLFYGPPGTGKTMLAKALAGEFKVPFFACNGAEFVEMYEGIAAERVKHIFNTARANSPSIIFIDEIDALGKKRSAFSDDPGVQEREQGLLQLLIEMDGFRPTERVLVIGATNMATDLDDALLRPGRFDRKFFIDTPSKQNRFKILEVHAKNRPLIPSKANPKHNDNDELLHHTARITPGFSGAGLENLLNEATILAVRRGEKVADMDMILELLELQSIGLKQPAGLESGISKQRLALFHASRAIACALTPDATPLKFVSLAIRRKKVTGLVFDLLDVTDEELRWWDILYLDRMAHNPQEGGDFSAFVRSLLPLCAGRAAEQVFSGSVSQLSTTDLSKASQLAHELIADSVLSGGTRENSAESDEKVALLFKELEICSKEFVLSHQKAIKSLASLLLKDEDVSLEQIKEIIDSKDAFPGSVTFLGKGKSGKLQFRDNNMAVSSLRADSNLTPTSMSFNKGTVKQNRVEAEPTNPVIASEREAFLNAEDFGVFPSLISSSK